MSKKDRASQQASPPGHDQTEAGNRRGRAQSDPAAEARATLEQLSQPSGLFDGWLLPRRPRSPDDGTAEQEGSPVPLGRILLGPAVLFAVLLAALVLLLRAVG